MYAKKTWVFDDDITDAALNHMETGIEQAHVIAEAAETPAGAQAKVNAAIAGLLNGAPGALDTLLELAAAMGNDPNFATTITNALAAKAPLASPALAGTPTAPTAAPGTNTLQLATTAFVEAVRVALANADALKAPLASPALTGTPTAPTAAAATNTIQIATTAFVKSQAYAPLASPALTGIPTAPTAAAATNSQQLATTAFVKAAIAALVDASPATLDTLNELAAALGDDPNFATTITNALAAKASTAYVDSAVLVEANKGLNQIRALSMGGMV